MASGSYDKTIKIWDPIKGELLKTLIGHTNAVESLAVLADNTLASCSNDKTIKIWDPIKGDLLKTLNGHSNNIWCLAVLPNNRLASGSYDSTITWELVLLSVFPATLTLEDNFAAKEFGI